MDSVYCLTLAGGSSAKRCNCRVLEGRSRSRVRSLSARAASMGNRVRDESYVRPPSAIERRRPSSADTRSGALPSSPRASTACARWHPRYAMTSGRVVVTLKVAFSRTTACRPRCSMRPSSSHDRGRIGWAASTIACRRSTRSCNSRYLSAGIVTESDLGSGPPRTTTKPPGKVIGILAGGGGSAEQIADNNPTTTRAAVPFTASRMQSPGMATPHSGQDSRSGTLYPVYLLCRTVQPGRTSPDTTSARTERIATVIRFNRGGCRALRERTAPGNCRSHARHYDSFTNTHTLETNSERVLRPCMNLLFAIVHTEWLFL